MRRNFEPSFNATFYMVKQLKIWRTTLPHLMECTQVVHWIRCSRTTTNDPERPGRLSVVTTEDIVNKILDIVFGRPTRQDTWDSWCYAHLDCKGFSHFPQNSRHEKAFCKMGTAFADSRSKTMSPTTSEQCLVMFVTSMSTEFLGRYVTFSWRNMSQSNGLLPRNVL